MTTELPDEMQAYGELFGQVSAYDSRADVGYAVGIVPRIARRISGDPVKYFTATSPNFNVSATLPDDPRAKSALCQVVGAPCFFRLDGTPPALAGEQTLPVGTMFLLTGVPSIKGFTFTATGIVACIITVNYFD